MAKYNEILVGRFNRALQKAFAMKGEPPAAQLGGEITPGIVLPWGVENRYLESWDRFGLAGAPVAAAANATSIRFRNPAGSNVLAVIEKLTLSFATADPNFNGSRGTATTDLATVPSGTLRMDPRGRANPTCVNSNNNGGTAAAALTGSTAFIGGLILANTLVDFISYEDEQLPVLPGDAIQVSCSVNASALGYIIWWRERYLEESEKT